MYLRPEDLRAFATERYRADRPSRRHAWPRLRLRSTWRQLAEAWNIRPRPRLAA